MKTDRTVDPGKELISCIQKLAQKYSMWRVFEDFLAMAAIAVSNTVDWTHRKEREESYEASAARYDEKDRELFPAMMMHLVNELERHAETPTDVLGKIFHDLELHNKWKGQFFTPQNVCDMMALMSISADDEQIASKGYITVSEPCAGSGAMILGFAKAMKNRGFDHTSQMVVTATDVDLKCVYMTYLQLSLYGIPAVVIHGDTLALKEWSRWYTPVYMLDGWVWRQACGNIGKRYPEDEAIKRASEPAYAAIRDIEALTAQEQTETSTTTPDAAEPIPAPDITLHEAADGQFSLII